MRSSLVLGRLFHARRDRFAQRRFQYPVYLAAIDLDELPELHERLRLFSYNRPNLFSLHDRDYRDAAATGVRAAALARFAQAGAPAPASIQLVTNLRVCGYGFNPVSFFVGYDASGAVAAVIAEVNNTYGGNLPYLLGPSQRLPGKPATQGAKVASFRHTRELFVSPFLHGPASYDFHFDAPPQGARLAVRMDVHSGLHAEGPRVFVAHVEGERRPLTDRALVAAGLRYPLMTAQVIGLIHYQALKLHLARVPYRRPGKDHRPLPEL